VVLNAKPQEGYLKKRTKLVVKVSWPTSSRVSEIEFLGKACAAATGEHAWVANHLPRVYCAEDITPGQIRPWSRLRVYSTRPNLPMTKRSCTNDGFSVSSSRNGWSRSDICRPWRRSGRFSLMLRVVRATRFASDISSANQARPAHHWLYAVPGILHRDISPNNIMCRYVNRVIRGTRTRVAYGVLMDYDLSSWTKDLITDYTKTSQQRTGTPPYMAQELLKGTSLESLFYVMFLTGARRTIGIPKGGAKLRVVMRKGKKLPFHGWFDQLDYKTLGSLKGTA
jgi:hypothetical protein